VVAAGTADELKRGVPGGHVRLRFADAARLDAAARALGDATGDVLRDDEALALQVPGDGGVPALRALLDRLERAAVEVEELSVHTPDLDDVFFALTGHPSTEKEAVR
jgi:ABC-2 type transport system ATP-binding protein